MFCLLCYNLAAFQEMTSCCSHAYSLGMDQISLSWITFPFGSTLYKNKWTWCNMNQMFNFSFDFYLTSIWPLCLFWHFPIPSSIANNFVKLEKRKKSGIGIQLWITVEGSINYLFRGWLHYTHRTCDGDSINVSNTSPAQIHKDVEILK